MNYITRFIEKLLYRNKKVIIQVEDGDNSRVTIYNLKRIQQVEMTAKQVDMVAHTLAIILKEYNKFNNSSYNAKVESVEEIIKTLCKQLKVDIKIDTNVKYYFKED
jgi:hypothetical protein